KSFVYPEEIHPVKKVSTKNVMRVGEEDGPKIALIDYGVKRNIVRELVKRGCNVVIYPHDTKAEEILKEEPDGILLSNGPGDPALLVDEIKTVSALLGHKPIAGICLGMQISALAAGGVTEKLKYGHRGANHAVKDVLSGKGFVTSQNHGYAVVESSLAGTGMIVTHINLGDGSVEGIKHEKLPIWGVQFHPEGSPGPLDFEFFFDDFLRSVKGV
ncbi:MAG: Carbamoyl-phosphate synthase small chain, partial [Thermovirga lienii]